MKTASRTKAALRIIVVAGAFIGIGLLATGALRGRDKVKISFEYWKGPSKFIEIPSDSEGQWTNLGLIKFDRSRDRETADVVFYELRFRFGGLKPIKGSGKLVDGWDTMFMSDVCINPTLSTSTCMYTAAMVPELRPDGSVRPNIFNANFVFEDPIVISPEDIDSYALSVKTTGATGYNLEKFTFKSDKKYGTTLRSRIGEEGSYEYEQARLSGSAKGKVLITYPE